MLRIPFDAAQRCRCFGTADHHWRDRVLVTSQLAGYVPLSPCPACSIKGGLAKPEDRHAAISRLCEQAGGKLVSLYFTLGQYDFTLISEIPDAKAASVLAFVATGGGGIEGSVTTQAFTTAEARDMFAAAGKIVGSYKPMGAS